MAALWLLITGFFFTLPVADLLYGGRMSQTWCLIFAYTATQFGLAVAVWLRCRWARIPALALLLTALCIPAYCIWLACTEGRGVTGPGALSFVGLIIGLMLAGALVFTVFIGLVAFWLYRLKLGSDTSIPTKEDT